MATAPPFLCSFPAEVGDPLGAFEAFVRGEGGESEEAVEEEEETGHPGQGPYYHRKGKTSCSLRITSKACCLAPRVGFTAKWMSFMPLNIMLTV